MSAAKARTPHKVTEPDAARKVALYDHPGYLDVMRAQAALWLLEQIDGGHLSFDQGPAGVADLEEWVRSIAKDAAAASLTTASTKLARASLEKVDTGKTVTS